MTSAGAQSRGRGRHVLMPSRYELRVESDVQLEVWYGADCESHRRLDDSIEPFDVEHGTGRVQVQEYTGEAFVCGAAACIITWMSGSGSASS